MIDVDTSRGVSGDTPPVFDNLDTFLDWDQDFYLPEEQKFYDLAVARMLALLGARPGDLVLDAGCGLGAHSIRAARAGCRVHAIDFSAPVLAEAKRRAQAAGLADRITFEHADLTKLHLPSESFSFVFSWGVLIHIPAVEEALQALARILKPNGCLALYVTNSSALDIKVEALGRKVLRRSRIVLEKHPLGSGYWYRERHGDIWVWQMDVDALTRYCEAQGLRRTHRLPGMLTEMHVRCPGLLRKLLVHANNLWFQWRLSPYPAEANLLIFEKPGAQDGGARRAAGSTTGRRS
jgi:ubiquinone/menaquinone biosynthesis C-methylase UbiE